MLNLEFATNPDPRCACIFLLDTSGSMKGAPIDALNEGLRSFEHDIQDDALARRRVEIAIITFGGITRQIQPWVSAGAFQAPVLTTGGGTPMGEAMYEGVRMINIRKAEYKAAGLSYYQPWVFLITDGTPTDEWLQAAAVVRRETAARGLTFFAVGVGDADMDTLKAITDRVLKLDGLSFRELFLWVSASQKGISRSKADEQTALPAVTFGSPA
ncbi:vWA domain-containing protein [Granulicella tundricola]|uniref:von Willebrand factor type A n=1 Tax=Granulicella tundricola (strain ATCC BAA-1859 / DSM 23138 / MP5ACTX9) TaxID=1198114 RepID=E8X663_GRATM|nr:VWA domain-containing protein [Granulicella tundricola]ADW70947.1 von Willebrand factor type A [Granulicella tundricola MP5ACTX9]